MKSESVSEPELISLSVTAVQSLIDEITRLKGEANRLEAQIRRLEKLAHLDPLVRLPNRRGLFRAIENVIGRLNRSGGTAALIFVDVDRMKDINDRFGHPTGDAALIEVSRILVETVRACDIVGRLAGDEFIVLLSDADELKAWNTALRIVEATTASIAEVNNHRIPLSIAVGVSTISPYDLTPDVISRADQSMYGVKTGSLSRSLAARRINAETSSRGTACRTTSI